MNTLRRIDGSVALEQCLGRDFAQHIELCMASEGQHIRHVMECH